jgi:hypothetical protein
MKHKKITICFIAVLIANSALAATYYVPEEYGTIQAAINACEDFDTVVIAPGTYRGLGNCGINFNGKAITVRSTDPTDSQIVNTTIIDCDGIARGFVFNTWEKADSKVAGLTIINGYAMVGGAIYSYNNSSPSITNCVISTSSAVFGGAIACTNSKSRPEITNCKITANSALVGGGGFYLNGSTPTIKNCIISGTLAPNGGAIYSHNAGNPVIVNCTISGNAASNSAGAIYCYKSSNLTISNSILWGNTATSASEVLVGNLGAPTSIRISYCDIQSPDENVIGDSDCTIDWGQGNIDIDPHFIKVGHIDNGINYVEGDYHLLEDSPCIDAGNPASIAGPDETDIDGNPRILGAKIDMGADEYKPPIPATVKVRPKTLNLASSGKWISCTIQLPDDYDISNVDTESINLNGKIIKAAWSRIDEEKQKLYVKFNRSEIFGTQTMPSDAENSVSLIIRGELNDGNDFKGDYTIRIVRSGGKK